MVDGIAVAAVVFVLGIGTLWLGADLFVTNAARVARRLGLSELAVGVTVVDGDLHAGMGRYDGAARQGPPRRSPSRPDRPIRTLQSRLLLPGRRSPLPPVGPYTRSGLG